MRKFPLNLTIDHLKEKPNHINILDENYLVKQHGICIDDSSAKLIDENMEAFVNKQVDINKCAPESFILVLR